MSQVNDLRKQGLLDDAYDLAQRQLEENKSLEARMDLGWVCYDRAKHANEQHNFSEMKQALDAIIDLNILQEETESARMLNDSLCYLFYQVYHSRKNFQPIDLRKLAKATFPYIENLQPSKPSRAYTMLLRGLLCLKDALPNFDKVLDQWDLTNLQPEDYEKQEYNNHRIIAVAEAAYIAKSKALIERNDKEGMRQLLPVLQQLQNDHSDMQLIGFYIGKLLLYSGTDLELARRQIILFAKRHKYEFWVWELLADAYEDEADLSLCCLLRAASCRTNPDFLVRIRRRLAVLLNERGDYTAAYDHLRESLAVRTRNGWAISEEDKELQQDILHKLQEGDGVPLQLDYMRLTNQRFFPEAEETVAIVTFVNEEKEIANIIYGFQKKGFFKYSFMREKPQIGQKLLVRVTDTSEDNYIRISSMRNLDTDYPASKYNNYIKDVTGNLAQSYSGSAYVLVNEWNDTFLVPKHLAPTDASGVHKGVAVLDFNRLRNRWGWIMLSLERVADNASDLGAPSVLANIDVSELDSQTGV